MKPIVIASTEEYSGKTAFSLGLSHLLTERKLSVGYMKPLGNRLIEENGKLVDQDASQVKKLLKLTADTSDISPIRLTPDLIQGVLTGKKNPKKALTEAYSRISKGKDVVLIEGAGTTGGGLMAGLSEAEIALQFKARILLVSRYDNDYVVDRILSAQKLIQSFGKNLLAGVIINDVPKNQMAHVKGTIVPFLKSKKISVLGVLPQDPKLRLVSVSAILERLGGQVLTGQNCLDRTVGSFVVGAMSPAYAMKYFRRTVNKAVITGADRSDLLMTAMETPTQCLILTGNVPPTSQVLARAQQCCIPTILVPQNTFETVQITEHLLTRLSITDKEKLAYFKNHLRKHINLKEFSAAFSLPKL
ncbi:ATP-dependent dethiobiotin synthetase BioD [uncultured archaeon]|nr:ATP-dependent dethiobiotin synthetase BioD [uncultured archaeon]